MRIALPLIIVFYAIEWVLLILSGRYIGVLPTIVIILLTGFIGFRLAKQQGLRLIHQARVEMARGQVPGTAVIEGLLVFFGGVLLIIPGYLSDLAGFLLLIPSVRRWLLWRIRNWIRRWLAKGRLFFWFRRP